MLQLKNSKKTQLEITSNCFFLSILMVFGLIMTNGNQFASCSAFNSSLPITIIFFQDLHWANWSFDPIEEGKLIWECYWIILELVSLHKTQVLFKETSPPTLFKIKDYNLQYSVSVKCRAQQQKKISNPTARYFFKDKLSRVQRKNLLVYRGVRRTIYCDWI